MTHTSPVMTSHTLPSPDHDGTHDHGASHDRHDHDGMPALERRCDVAIIGGSAAGLAAALR